MKAIRFYKWKIRIYSWTTAGHTKRNPHICWGWIADRTDTEIRIESTTGYANKAGAQRKWRQFAKDNNIPKENWKYDN